MLPQEFQMCLNAGLTPDQARKLGKYMKGKKTSLSSGTTTINIQIPGTAQALLGFSVAVEDAIDMAGVFQFTAKLNNDTILEIVDISTFVPENNQVATLGYIECFRTMQGADVLEITIVGSNSVNLAVIQVHYLGNVNSNWRKQIAD